MATETVENYLKAIYKLSSESTRGEAAMSRIALVLGVTTGTATTMVKKLAAAKLCRYERFGGVTLTAKGERIAVDVLRRHRIIETFLVETLKLDWSVVHAEAERLEHAVSPVVLEALDAHLGRPSVDPHGDPILDAEGRTREPRGEPLSSFPAGSRVRVTRITDQSEEFLSFVAMHGLRPGALAVVVFVDPSAQSTRVRSRGHREIAMATSVANRIFCRSTKQNVMD